MNDVKRYDCNGMECGADYSHMRFVLASDYDALAQRCRELEMQLENAHRATNSECMDWAREYERRKEIQAENDTLRAEVERLRKDAARLDWLAKRLEDMVVDGADPCDHATDAEEDWPTLWRRAIDTARRRDGAPE